MKVMYRVSGMTCGGCARAVGKAIERVSAELRPRVDLSAGVVEVEGSHEEDTLRKAVEAAGYGWHGPAPTA
jgi:copper chaperone